MLKNKLSLSTILGISFIGTALASIIELYSIFLSAAEFHSGEPPTSYLLNDKIIFAIKILLGFFSGLLILQKKKLGRRLALLFLIGEVLLLISNTIRVPFSIPFGGQEYFLLYNFLLNFFFYLFVFFILYNQQMDEELGITRKQHPAFDDVIDQV